MQANTAAPVAQDAPGLTALQTAVYAALMNGPAFESFQNGELLWDANTGLLWDNREPQAVKDHAHAVELAKAMDLGGYTEWRVPKRPELCTNVNLAARNPAVYPAMAKTTPTDDWYITDSEVEGYPSYVWVVFFSYGSVGSYDRSFTGRLRAVCGPVPRPGQ